MLIKGESIKLKVRTISSKDDFNRDTFEDSWVDVDNVLISPTTENEIIDTLNLTGKKAVYTLSIPKGDRNCWENTQVQFFGETWNTIGKPIKVMDAYAPLDWNTKVRVEKIG